MSSEVNNAHISVGKEQLPINSPFKKEGTKSVSIAVCDHLTFPPTYSRLQDNLGWTVSLGGTSSLSSSACSSVCLALS